MKERLQRAISLFRTGEKASLIELIGRVPLHERTAFLRTLQDKLVRDQDPHSYNSREKAWNDIVGRQTLLRRAIEISLAGHHPLGTLGPVDLVPPGLLQTILGPLYIGHLTLCPCGHFNALGAMTQCHCRPEAVKQWLQRKSSHEFQSKCELILELQVPRIEEYHATAQPAWADVWGRVEHRSSDETLPFEATVANLQKFAVEYLSLLPGQIEKVRSIALTIAHLRLRQEIDPSDFLEALQYGNSRIIPELVK